MVKFLFIIERFTTVSFCELHNIVSFCEFGSAYHHGALINTNKKVNNAHECLQQCNDLPDCSFWDYGTKSEFCRLRKNSGKGPVNATSSFSGSKNCKFGTNKS